MMARMTSLDVQIQLLMTPLRDRASILQQVELINPQVSLPSLVHDGDHRILSL